MLTLSSRTVTSIWLHCPLTGPLPAADPLFSLRCLSKCNLLQFLRIESSPIRSSSFFGKCQSTCQTAVFTWIWTLPLRWPCVCTMRTPLLDALSTPLGESLRTHARTHTHTQTQGAVTFLSHNHGNGLRWSEDRCPELYKFSWRTEQRSAFLLPPPSYLHTCWTALTQLPAPNLVFPQRWHMYQAEQEMSWAGREQLSDRCHLQSAQACFWCVNYSINHHITLSGCQHLITYETLPVNGLKYVCVYDRSHIMLLLTTSWFT